MKSKQILLVCGILLPFFLFLISIHFIFKKTTTLNPFVELQRIGSDDILFPFFDKEKNTLNYWIAEEKMLKTIDLSRPRRNAKKQKININTKTTDLLWAPDGNAFAGKEADGLRIYSLSQYVGYSVNGSIGNAVWSPDAKKLLYQKFKNKESPESTLELFMVDSGSGERYFDLGRPEASFSDGSVLLSWPTDKKVLYADLNTDQSLPTWWNIAPEASVDDILSGVDFLEWSPDKKKYLTEVAKPDNPEYTIYAIWNLETNQEIKTNIARQDSLCTWRNERHLLCVTIRPGLPAYIGSINLETGEYTLHAAVSSLDIDIKQNPRLIHAVGNKFFYISSVDQKLYSVKLKNI